MDKGERSITLKPEGTAGAVRAFVESGLYSQALPLKMYYLNAPIFRYEAPQSGRLREHHQFGVECFGASQPSADAEVIVLACELLASLGLQNLAVRINSIGCPKCRPVYQQLFREYLNGKLPDLCGNCKERAQINPMRTLDCKVPSCKEALQDAPVMMDTLCDECRAHFEQLKQYLEAAGIRYVVDTRIVRGLDYYTKSVFEITTEIDGGELTVCGGGRYDGLVEELGGPSVPAAGFGMGIERVIMLLDKLGESKLTIPSEKPDVYVANLGAAQAVAAFRLMEDFRRSGVKADMDHAGRSLKAQFKYADKLGAAYVAVLGEDELKQGAVKLRDMATREEWTLPLGSAPEQIKERLQKSAKEENV